MRKALLITAAVLIALLVAALWRQARRPKTVSAPPPVVSRPKPPFLRDGSSVGRFVHGRTGLLFLFVRGGEFEMGSPDHEPGRYGDEGPVRRVVVKPFLLCESECTRTAWEAGAGRVFKPRQDGNLPATGVAWDECHEWCVANGFRLPTEAEWEFACRAGTTTPWSFPDAAGADGQAWYGSFRRGPGNVCGRKPNPWGFFDMHGNVWEWCEDTWHDSLAGAPTDGTAWTDGDDGRRVIRGGSYLTSLAGLRSAIRGAQDARIGWFDQGFRPAADVPPDLPDSALAAGGKQ